MNETSFVQILSFSLTIFLIFSIVGIILWPSMATYAWFLIVLRAPALISLYLIGWFVYIRKSYFAGWLQIIYSFVWFVAHGMIIYILLCGLIAPASGDASNNSCCLPLRDFFMLFQPVCAGSSFNAGIFVVLKFRPHLYISIIGAIIISMFFFIFLKG